MPDYQEYEIPLGSTSYPSIYNRFVNRVAAEVSRLEDGVTGPQGDQGPVGPVGPMGPAGDAAAMVALNNVSAWANEAMRLAAQGAAAWRDFAVARLITGTVTLSNTQMKAGGWLFTAQPTALITLPVLLPRTDYAVALAVESATRARMVGELYVANKATNGFRIYMTGSADAVVVRWLVANPALM